MNRLAIAACAFLLSLGLSTTSASAAPLSADRAGQLTAEMDSRKKDILDKDFGGKDPSKMNSRERREFQKKSNEIENQVLKENGVSKGAYSASMMRATKNSPIEKSRAEHAKKIEADKKAKAEAEKQKQTASGEQTGQSEVVIERDGQSADNAMSVEGGVMVQRGGQ